MKGWKPSVFSMLRETNMKNLGNHNISEKHKPGRYKSVMLLLIHRANS